MVMDHICVDAEGHTSKTNVEERPIAMKILKQEKTAQRRKKTGRWSLGLWKPGPNSIPENSKAKHPTLNFFLKI